jgi:hypothetical protein
MLFLSYNIKKVQNACHIVILIVFNGVIYYCYHFFLSLHMNKVPEMLY